MSLLLVFSTASGQIAEVAPALGTRTPLSVRHEKPPLRISVWLYSYAQVSSRTLAIAEEEATRIFQAAGVETVWAELPPTAGGQQPQPPSPQDMPSWEFVLVITTSVKAGRLVDHFDPLGFAPSCAANGSTCRAYAFWDRVQDAAHDHGADPACILGHVMAHEMGHLLLGPHSHSPTGIMQGIWLWTALGRAGRGVLLFTPQQAEVIRAEVDRRDHMEVTVDQEPER
jgi:hypothetical protein